MLVARALSYPRTGTLNMEKTGGCVCTLLRKTNGRDLHCGACRSSSWTDQPFIQLSEEELYMLHLTRFWHLGGLPLFGAIQFIHTCIGRLTAPQQT